MDIDASFDGTWQKRGHSSLNGIVTAISRDTGKCFDYRVMSKNCSGCRIWKDKEGTAEYNRFSVDHKCSANFEDLLVPWRLLVYSNVSSNLWKYIKLE